MQPSSPRTAAALAVAAAALLAPAADAATTRAKVIRVVDGDSVRVSVGGTARTVHLLGVDSPVGRDCFAAEATTALRRMLPRGAAVRLTTDARRRGSTSSAAAGSSTRRCSPAASRRPTGSTACATARA